MKRKRHGTDEVIRKLREAEAMEAAGTSRAEVLQKLEVSEQTLLLLPPYSPELMPMERVWAWMRQHHLSNRVFEDEAAIDAAIASRWNTLTPERLRSITATRWLTHEN